MKCVGYDIRFQREVAERYARWEPEQEKKSSKRDRKRKRGVNQDTSDDEATPTPPTKHQRPPPSFYGDGYDELGDLSDLTDIE